MQKMPEQYYTPDPEDFRRGFIFEVLYLYPSIEWRQEIFDFPNNKYCYCSVVQLEEALGKYKWADHLRVKYLTTEHIEAEGWTRQRDTNIFHKTINSLCEYRLWFEPDLKTINIDKCIMDDINDIYNGTCRCINDFRLICKLLNIN